MIYIFSLVYTEISSKNRVNNLKYIQSLFIKMHLRKPTCFVQPKFFQFIFSNASFSLFIRNPVSLLIKILVWVNPFSHFSKLSLPSSTIF